MAELVLGIGTSHTPLLALPAELWERYAEGDRRNTELVFPPDGWAMGFTDAVQTYVREDVRLRRGDLATFEAQAERCRAAIEQLASTIEEVDPDVVVIVSDDQDELFYEANMPSLAVYWGETITLIPRQGPSRRDATLTRLIAEGYGAHELEVPVAAQLGRHLIEHLRDHDFDPAQLTYLEDSYGGRVARRYPTRSGELDVVRDTARRRQGLPHGYAFVVARLFRDAPRTILPVIQNTCYPPNQVTPRRCYQIGRAIADALAAWDEPLRVAVVASGGLSHFVVDEELDRMLLDALKRKDGEALQALPRHRLYSATSESLNWVTTGAALEQTPLQFELVDYVPVYRTEAGTGGGWCFATWR